jgi:IrrE N-terminal-like domain
MSFAFHLKMAKQKGEACAKEQGYIALPVDPIAIALKNDIEVRPKPDTAEGVSGMLLRHGNEFCIAYATHIPSEGFQHFSIGHELGHYFLDGHVDHVLKDGVHVSEAGFTSADPYEMEADQFAAGLLMPGTLFKSALRKRDAGLATVEKMAGLCRTSLTATGIRCAELSDDALAVIISTGSAIDFCFLSGAMKTLPQLSWLRKGAPVPAGTLTARFNADRRRVLGAERAAEEIDVMDWLGGTLSARVTEEVVGLGRYSKTLTVLSSEVIGQDLSELDDEREDDDLRERWTPRFRK